MLATPGALPPSALEDRWAFEVKQDGQRAMIYVPGDGTVLVRSRSGADITAAYPELLPLADACGGRPAVLDGEIVALDDRGHGDFELLQQRMGLAGSPARAVYTAARVPAHLMLFDVAHLDSRPVTGLPYTALRGLLEGLGLAGPAWSTLAAIVGHGAQAWEVVRDAGLEGLLAKRLTSRYEPGVRSKAWLKIKIHHLADVVIGGWVPGRGRLNGRPARFSSGSGARDCCTTRAASVPGGARPNAPASPSSCGSRPLATARLPRSRRWPGHGG